MGIYFLYGYIWLNMPVRVIQVIQDMTVVMLTDQVAGKVTVGQVVHAKRFQAQRLSLQLVKYLWSLYKKSLFLSLCKMVGQ